MGGGSGGGGTPWAERTARERDPVGGAGGGAPRKGQG